VRGFGANFRRFRAGGMSSSAFSCEGGGVRGRQEAGRTGEFGGELSGELGMELRGEERSEIASEYMLSWGRLVVCCSGRCIREPAISFQKAGWELKKCDSDLVEVVIPSTHKVATRPLSPARGVNERQRRWRHMRLPK
jgi:hypothetical protein